MKTEPQRPKEWEGVASALNVAIEAMNLAKEVSSITPAKAVFGSASVLLAMIRVGLLVLCCRSLAEMAQDVMTGLNELSNSVCDAIKQLTA